MPVTVVRSYPMRHTARRLRQSANTVAGALLVLLGLLGSLVLLPAGFAAFAVSAGEDMGSFPLSGGEIVLVAVLSIVATVFGFSSGIRLLRGKRVGILFLRRFGYDDATRVASYAAAKTIGRSWRLVTLDDAEVTPLGMSVLPGLLLRANALWRVLRAVRVLFRARTIKIAAALPVVIFALAVVKIELLKSGGSYDPFGSALRDAGSALGEGRVPFGAIDSSLAGAFVASLIALGFTLLMAFVALIVLLASMFFLGISSALSSAAEAARTAERLTRIDVNNRADVEVVASILADATQKIFAPRFIVLRVAPEAWRDTVMQLSALAPLTVIDVSQPSENLLWEMQRLADAELGSRCVFIGHSDQVEALANGGAGVPFSDELLEQMSLLLDGHEVLVYTSGRRGTRQFARALRTKLMDAETSAANARPLVAT